MKKLEKISSALFSEEMDKLKMSNTLGGVPTISVVTRWSGEEKPDLPVATATFIGEVQSDTDAGNPHLTRR